MQRSPDSDNGNSNIEKWGHFPLSMIHHFRSRMQFNFKPFGIHDSFQKTAYDEINYIFNVSASLCGDPRPWKQTANNRDQFASCAHSYSHPTNRTFQLQRKFSQRHNRIIYLSGTHGDVRLSDFKGGVSIRRSLIEGGRDTENFNFIVGHISDWDGGELADKMNGKAGMTRDQKLNFRGTWIWLNCKSEGDPPRISTDFLVYTNEILFRTISH